MILAVIRQECAICGGPTQIRTHVGVRFSECRSCGYGQIDVPGREDYWSPQHESGTDDAYWTRAKQNYFDSALRLLQSLTDGRRLLDVGGGLGVFARRALETGWDAYTLDISPAIAERAAQRVGSDRSLVAVPPNMLGTFHAVTMWCVVAHTFDPVSLLATARSALVPNGLLWVTTPNFAFQKPYAYFRGRLGRPLDFAREDHVGHFTSRSLDRLMSASGFADVRFHFCGITECCLAADSQSRVLVEGKRLWNCTAIRLNSNLVSELQMTARSCRAETNGLANAAP